jgi:hypothetical protein
MAAVAGSRAAGLKRATSSRVLHSTVLACLLAACGGRVAPDAPTGPVSRDAAPEAASGLDAGVDGAALDGTLEGGGSGAPCTVDSNCRYGDICVGGRCCNGDHGEAGACRCGSGPGCGSTEVCCPSSFSPTLERACLADRIYCASL